MASGREVAREALLSGGREAGVPPARPAPGARSCRGPPAPWRGNLYFYLRRQKYIFCCSHAIHFEVRRWGHKLQQFPPAAATRPTRSSPVTMHAMRGLSPPKSGDPTKMFFLSPPPPDSLCLHLALRTVGSGNVLKRSPQTSNLFFFIRRIILKLSVVTFSKYFMRTQPRGT